MSDPIREAFETWAKGVEIDLNRFPKGSPAWAAGQYMDTNTNVAFAAWQAAWRAAQPRWRPIETAPMDQTAVLVYDADGDAWATAFWDDVENRWYETSTLEVFIGRPTHWMPLPEPPNGSAK